MKGYYIGNGRTVCYISKDAYTYQRIRIYDATYWQVGTMDLAWGTRDNTERTN